MISFKDFIAKKMAEHSCGSDIMVCEIDMGKICENINKTLPELNISHQRQMAVFARGLTLTLMKRAKKDPPELMAILSALYFDSLYYREIYEHEKAINSSIKKVDEAIAAAKENTK